MKTFVPKPRIDKPKPMTKATSKRSSTVGGHTRYDLLNPRATRRSASAKQAYLIRQEFDNSIMDLERGEALKQGVEGMANMVAMDGVITQEQLEKIQAMDAGNLQVMYDANYLIFEVYFNYGGISESSQYPGAKTVDQSKASDIQYLIEQYEKTFGAIDL